MAFMKPQSLRPLPRYYYSPTYRGAETDVRGGQIDALYKTRKMEGTLGGVFNVLLAGERASGTVLYGARKKLGFGEIDWIEQAEPGTYGYRRISPSEALGVKGYDDKFWTARGITSLALDIVLDPTTYIGVGLAGKTMKLGSLATRGVAKKGAIRVGTRGVEFLAQTQARGISRATAERKLFEYMGRDPRVHAEMMERGGAMAVKFMGKPIMKTARVTEPAGAMWRAAPMYATRADVLENLRTKFIPFHKLTQQIDASAVAPFREFYRATGVRRTQWDRSVQRMAHDVPEGFGVPIARYLELGEMPTSNVDEILRLAKQQQSEYARMYQEKVSVGLLKQEQFIQHYMPHVPTEQAMMYAEKRLPKLAGRRREETAALYLRSMKSAKERLVAEDVFAANVYMRKKTGIEQWFETDPFVAFQKYGVEHIMGMESEYLRRRIATQMGFRDTPKTVSKYVDVAPAKRLPSLIKGYRLTHQERALQSLRDIVAAGGDVEKINLPHALQELKSRGIFGKVRPEGKTPWAWMRERFEGTISEYHRYKREIWGLEKEEMDFAQQITGELRRRVISRKDVARFERSMDLTRRGILHREEMIANITRGIRVEGGAVGRELIDPAERAVLKYRRVYEAEIGKLPGRRLITKELPLERTLERGGILYQLEKGDYIPTEAFAEYARRIPTTGWGSRLETKFKKTLTSIWPAFHARNLYGMVGWQNVLAGAGLRGYKTNIAVLRKTSPWMKKHVPWAVGDVGKLFDVPFMGKKTAAEMRVIAEEAEIYGITGMVDVAATYSVKRGGIQAKLGRYYEQVPQELMVGVESVGRGALFWDRLMKGVPIESAMKDVEKFHFRYGGGALTEFETDYMRHGFLFYRWMRGNIPLQAQMSIEKPYMYAGLGKLHTRGSSPSDRERLQDWQKERFGATIGGTFVALDIPFYEHPALMLNPSNWEDLYFAMTPAIKFPVGILAGRDPATGAPIEDWDARRRFATSQFMGRGVYAQREIAKTLSGERPVSWTAIHQLGGVGVYELSDTPMYTGMTTMPRMPSGIRGMGVTQEKWTEYQLARGWTPRLTDVSRAEIYQQHGGVCSVCGTPCSPEHKCTSQLIIPTEQGGTYTPSNTVLVCESCSGTFRRNISPMMRMSLQGHHVPSEYRTSFADKEKIWGVIDQYMDAASLVE
ncbi:MAG: HNH endonuclease [Candidatus Methanospirareceae archaeon]